MVEGRMVYGQGIWNWMLSRQWNVVVGTRCMMVYWQMGEVEYVCSGMV